MCAHAISSSAGCKAQRWEKALMLVFLRRTSSTHQDDLNYCCLPAEGISSFFWKKFQWVSSTTFSLPTPTARLEPQLGYCELFFMVCNVLTTIHLTVPLFRSNVLRATGSETVSLQTWHFQSNSDYIQQDFVMSKPKGMRCSPRPETNKTVRREGWQNGSAGKEACCQF